MALTKGDGERNHTNSETKHADGCWISETLAEVTGDWSLGRDEQLLVELWCQSHGLSQLIAKLLLRIEVRVVGRDGVVISSRHC